MLTFKGKYWAIFYSQYLPQEKWWISKYTCHDMMKLSSDLSIYPQDTDTATLCTEIIIMDFRFDNVEDRRVGAYRRTVSGNFVKYVILSILFFWCNYLF